MANEASVKSIKEIEGFIQGKELIDKGLIFWTVTVWKSDLAMKHFRNNDPHKSAMRNLPNWCSEAAYVHWEQDEQLIPAWDILYKRLLTEGKLTKVKHPSAQQGGMHYPAPLWVRAERPIKPNVQS